MLNYVRTKTNRTTRISHCILRICPYLLHNVPRNKFKRLARNENNHVYLPIQNQLVFDKMALDKNFMTGDV